MADTIKCPNCGANLTLNADTQMLDCPMCGASFEPSKLDVGVGELDGGSAAYSAQEAKPAEPSQPQAEQAQGAPEQTEFICNSCGAKLVTDSHTAATFCAFCGSPALVGKRLTDTFQPQYMIPFKYSRESAEEAFVKWAGKGKWTPFGFVSKKNVAKMTGLYVPFWLFDIRATVDVQGTGDKVSYSGSDQITETFEFERKANLRWSHVPLDGETRVDDALMEAIEPFDFKGLIPYDYRYLPGFYADRYDQSPQDLAARATKRGMEGVDKAIKDSLKGKYDRYRIKKNMSKINSMDAYYALLPVWFLSYKYRNKFYYFTMNGQTGEVAGTVPVSPVKKMSSSSSFWAFWLLSQDSSWDLS